MKNEKILNQIEESFKDVNLEDGIGYFQSIAMDNLDDRDDFMEAIKKDKEFGIDWKKIKGLCKEK